MEKKDFIKLRCRILQDFKHWFSYSRSHNVLYCDWKPVDNELNDLLHFVEPFGLNVLFVPPCSVIIFAV